MDELFQISQFIPEVKDRYYINKKGELFTNNGEKRMKDGIKNGYVKNVLIFKDGTQKAFFRHRLVMMCFCPTKNQNDLQVNHKDGNKLNNSLDNLEWVTNQENRIHAVKMGLAAKMIGQTNPMSKLLEEQVIDIIHDLLNCVPYSEILQKYPFISKASIAAIKNKRNWTYLTKDIEFE